MRRGILSLILGVVVALGLLAWSVMYTVGEHEVAVVYRLNDFRTVMGDVEAEKGLQWKLPYPFDTVRVLDTRIQVKEYPEVQVMTGAGGLADQTGIGYESIVVSLTVGWEVAIDARAGGRAASMARTFVEKNGGNGSFVAAETNLKVQVDNFRQEIFSSYPLDAFVTTDRQKQRFDKVEARMREELNKKTIDTFGIRVRWVRVSGLGYPKSTINTVEEFMKQDRRKVSEGIKNEGIIEASKIRAKAQTEKGEAIAQAEADALARRATADTTAAEAYRKLEQYPELAGFFTKLDTLARLKKRLTLVIDPRTPPFDILAKPLEELVNRRAADKEGADE